MALLRLEVLGSIRDVLARDWDRLWSHEPAPATPFVTNAPPPGGGRDVTIVLDEEAIVPGREKPVRDALALMDYRPGK